MVNINLHFISHRLQVKIVDYLLKLRFRRG